MGAPFRLILLRHGETVWNRERRFQGSRDVPLSPEGQRQAEAVARTLAAELPAGVYSSPLARARDTARIVAAPHGLSVETEAAFTETCFGAWEGLTADEVRIKFPDVYAAWRSEPHVVRFPGGEDLAATRRRAVAGIEELAANHPGATVILVSHGVVVRLIVLDALGLGEQRLWAVAAEPGGITEIEYGAGFTTVHRMNTRQHLEATGAP